MVTTMPSQEAISPRDGRFRILKAIPMTAEVFWSRVGGFAGLAAAFPPGVVRLEGAGVGATRTFDTPDGPLVERCLDEDTKALFYTYTIEAGPLPLAQFEARFDVRQDVADSCIVSWCGNLRTAAGVSAGALVGDLHRNLADMLNLLARAAGRLGNGDGDGDAHE